MNTQKPAGPSWAILIGVVVLAGGAILIGLALSPPPAEIAEPAQVAQPVAEPAPAEAVVADAAAVAEGKKIAFDRKKGNCLACHAMDDGMSPGNIGPPLVVMQTRFPDRAKLHAQVWDATQTNPESIMPPFGKHKILSEPEIDRIVDYLLTL